MKYHIWNRETGRLLGTCQYKQTAYDFRKTQATKISKPVSAFRISFEDLETPPDWHEDFPYRGQK